MYPKLEDYIFKHIDDEDEVLHELYRETYLTCLNPRMASGHIQASFLKMLVHMIRPVNILEIGTFTAYTAISMAKALAENACVHTIEIDDERLSFINKYILKSNSSKKIKVYIGDALQIIPQMDLCFDMVFIDAHKPDYCDYYQLVMKKVKSGSFIIADNVLWDNKVIDIQAQDASTKALRLFNKLVKDDNRVEKVILPIRDGISILRVK